jgi:phospholipid/cholesterol/gamma-HCH transport system substrate-binding protein
MTDAPTGRSARRPPSDEDIQRALPKAESSREVRLGVFVLLGLVSFVVILFLLTDPATLRGRYLVTTTVEHAGGIRRGDPVQMRGVNIGRIHAFEMRPNGMVEITLEIDGEWEIPEDSHTRLGGAGLFGGRTMEVVRGESEELLRSGENIPGADEAPDPLDLVTELGEKAGTTLSRINALLDTGTVASVQASAGDLERLLAELSVMAGEQRATMSRLSSSLAATAEQLEDAGPDARRALSRADSTMAVLAATSRNLDGTTTSLRGLLARIDRGEGTLGRLSTDDALYVNMNRAAESLAALVDDIRANPNRYINISIF